MKKRKLKKLISLTAATALLTSCFSVGVFADQSKVVTLGANLSDEQKAEMYEYFGTSADEVSTITVTNQDERKYMEGIATEAQIGTRTYSCSYVEPTEEGGIQVKVANLTFVTSGMIASTLLTSGVENCNVVAASPIAVSGTGALTGIMMAYESASGEDLDEDQKSTAMEELVTTGELADDIGTDEAADLINDIKEEVIENDLEDPEAIAEVVEEAASDAGVALTDEQMQQITELMEKISQYDYDVNALKETLDNLTGDGDSEGFFDKIKNLFSSGKEEVGGIINNTNDDILGDNAVVDSTLEKIEEAANSEEAQGFFDKVISFFNGLFD